MGGFLIWELVLIVVMTQSNQKVHQISKVRMPQRHKIFLAYLGRALCVAPQYNAQGASYFGIGRTHLGIRVLVVQDLQSAVPLQGPSHVPQLAVHLNVVETKGIYLKLTRLSGVKSFVASIPPTALSLTRKTRHRQGVTSTRGGANDKAWF